MQRVHFRPQGSHTEQGWCTTHRCIHGVPSSSGSLLQHLVVLALSQLQPVHILANALADEDAGPGQVLPQDALRLLQGYALTLYDLPCQPGTRGMPSSMMHKTFQTGWRQRPFLVAV